MKSEYKQRPAWHPNSGMTYVSYRAEGVDDWDLMCKAHDSQELFKLLHRISYGMEFNLSRKSRDKIRTEFDILNLDSKKNKSEGLKNMEKEADEAQTKRLLEIAREKARETEAKAFKEKIKQAVREVLDEREKDNDGKMDGDSVSDFLMEEQDKK